jgi:hypothetical protein
VYGAKKGRSRLIGDGIEQTIMLARARIDLNRRVLKRADDQLCGKARLQPGARMSTQPLRPMRFGSVGVVLTTTTTTTMMKNQGKMQWIMGRGKGALMEGNRMIVYDVGWQSASVLGWQFSMVTSGPP